ncbi:MAG: hypothetical protein AAFY88_01550 [Acidobacteriota bacterium]
MRFITSPKLSVTRSSPTPRRTRRLPISLVRSCCIAGLFLLLAPGQAVAADHYLGIGALFFKTIDDLAGDGFDDIEEDGYAFLASYRYEPRGLFFLQGDVEYYPDGFGGSTDGTLVPVGYLGFGGSWYVAVGIGSSISGDLEDDISEPFWAARVGKAFDVLPGIGADIHLNYRADAYEELEDASTDAITVGATIRFNL